MTESANCVWVLSVSISPPGPDRGREARLTSMIKGVPKSLGMYWPRVGGIGDGIMCRSRVFILEKSGTNTSRWPDSGFWTAYQIATVFVGRPFVGRPFVGLAILVSRGQRLQETWWTGRLYRNTVTPLVWRYIYMLKRSCAHRTSRNGKHWRQIGNKKSATTVALFGRYQR